MRKSSLVLSLAPAASAATAATATISAGLVIGTTTAVSSENSTTIAVDQYLGIPYAEPPLGDLRFAPPNPPASRGNGTLQATSWPNACIQQGSADLLTPESEDCLYLNVFAPSSAPDGNDTRAVMVWIHGGSLKTGSASIAEYDGSTLAATQDVVVVAINYRLGALGFSNAPALEPASRNAGFLDQRLALAWVRDNIAAFGAADPAKVTVFGESSGSTSVSRLVGTMADDPPFRAAILESGWYDYASIMDVAGDVAGEQAWDALVAQLNCSAPAGGAELACVRAVDVAEIQSAVTDLGFVTFTAVNDNVTQLAEPERARREGRVARVPILTGSNANEGTLFQDATLESLAAYVVTVPTLESVEAEVAAAYPVAGDNSTTSSSSAYSSQFYADAAIDTDVEFTCPTSRIAALTASSLRVPTWRYYFNATFPNTAIEGYGIYHSSEVSLVFGTFAADNATAEERALSAAMQQAWAGFAKDPWGEGPGWPRVNCGLSRPDGYAVAALNVDGVAVIRNGTIDGNCWIYQSIYDNAVGGTPWW